MITEEKRRAVARLADELMAASTPECPVWNQELLQGHTEPGWNYIDGCMCKALLDLYQATGEERYFDFVRNFTDYYVNDCGNILGYRKEEFNSDNINGGKVLFPLYEKTGGEKYRLAIETLMDQLRHQPRTRQGSFWHKRIYPNQVWLDGLYMTLPFYMAYEARFDEYSHYRDIFGQFETARGALKDSRTHLLYHGYDETRRAPWADTESGCSRNFWSRSLGWYAMALLDTAEFLDEQLFDEREALQNYLREILDALLRHADGETGLLWQVTDRGRQPGNYLETSSSCALAYSLMKGSRLGFLPEMYYNNGKRVFDAVVEHKLTVADKTVVLRDICLVAGLGVYPGRGDYKERDGSYLYYISEPRVDNDAKGVAPFLMAYAEVLRQEGIG